MSPFCEEYLIDVTATPLTAPDPFNTHLFYGRVLTTIFCMAARPKLSTTRNICAPSPGCQTSGLAGHAAPDEPILHEPKHGAGVRVRARNERDTAPLRIRQPPLIYDSVLWSDDPGRTPGCTPVSGPHSGLKGGGGGFTTPARRNSACKSEGQNSHTRSSVRPGIGRQARSPVSASMRMVRNTPDDRVGERPGIYHVSVVSPHRETSRSPVAVHTVSRVMFRPSC